MQTGITGLPAPELAGVRWIGDDGKPRGNVSLDELGAGFKILYFFQDWCPGCHAHGFPTLVKLVEALRGVGFAVIQTVFEGVQVNTFDRLAHNQQRYGLRVPFGHAAPTAADQISAIMRAYRTGGTPWFVLIAPDGRVVYDGFQLDPVALIPVLRKASAA